MAGESGQPAAGQQAPAAAPAAPPRTEFYSKLLVVLFLAAVLCLLLVEAPWARETTEASRNQTTPPVAELLFSNFGASFLLLSIVMGAAIIGGLFLAREDPADDEGTGDTAEDRPEAGLLGRRGPTAVGPLGPEDRSAVLPGRDERSSSAGVQGAGDDGKGGAGGKEDGSGGGAR